MSGSVELQIITGSDWAVQIKWTDQLANPIPFTNPMMDIRQEMSPKGTQIARLDSSGLLDGTIDIPEDGTLILRMDKSVTNNLQTGRGFWDLFVFVNDNRTRLAFGTISITPHVTVL